jgi:hypothetical protein
MGNTRRSDGARPDFFVYAPDPFVFAAAGTLPFNIPIQSDGDFELAYITANATSVTIPSATLMITDNASNRRLFNVPIALDLITGSGQRPFALPSTHVFARTGTMLVEVTNLVAGANTIRVALIGWKWMQGGGQ